MIKTELKLFYTPTIPLGNNSFQYYTESWSSAITGTSTETYPSLTDSGYTTIKVLSGWTWKDQFLLSDSGSTESVYQDIFSGYTFITPVDTFLLRFVVKGVEDPYSTYGITPFIMGQSGTTVYTDGYYEQYIQVDSGLTTDTFLQFIPDAGFYGGISQTTVGSITIKTVAVDLYDDETVNLTFQITTSITNRGSSYTKDIIIPGTSKNNDVFRNILDIGYWFDETTLANDNVVFLNKKIQAAILQDSVEILYGYFELTEISNTNGKIEYKGVFYSNNRNLADVIGDKQIKHNEKTSDDIDFSQYNHLFNWTNIRNSFPPYYWNPVANWNSSTYYVQGTRVYYNSLLYVCINSNNNLIPPTHPTFWQSINNYTTSTGYYYPVINFSGYKDGDYIRLENFKPCIYVKELFDRIISKAGFTYSSSFLNSNTFKSLVIPVGNTLSEFLMSLDNTKFMVGKTAPQTLTLSTQPGIGYYDVTFPKVSGTLAGGTIYFNNNNTWNTSTNKWVVQSNGRYGISAILKLGIHTDPGGGYTYWGADPGHSTVTFNAQIWRKKLNNQTECLVDTPTVYQFFPYAGQNIAGWTVPQNSLEVPALVDEVMLYAGESVYVKLIMNSDVYAYVFDGENWIPDPYGLDLYAQIATSDDTLGAVPTQFKNIPVENNYYYENCMVMMNDALPEMGQMDFIKAIFNRFCLAIVEDKSVQNNLIIEPFEDFYYTGVTNYVDWTYKVDQFELIKTERIPDLIDLDMSFQFKQDTNDMLLDTYYKKWKRSFGDKLVINPYYTADKEIISDAFSSTFIENLMQTNWQTSAIYRIDNWATDYTECPTDTNYELRMLYRNWLNSGNTNRLFTTVNILAPDTGQLALRGWLGKNGYPYAGYLDNPFNPSLDLNYGVALQNSYLQNPLFTTTNNIVWRYWRKKLGMYLIDVNSKFVTFRMRLNPSDIATMDFRRKIMVDGHLYLLYRIRDWNPDTAIDVELILDTPLQDITNYLNPQASLPTSYLTPPKTTPNNTIDLVPIQPRVFMDYTGYTMTDPLNYYPQGATGIVVGKSNIIGANNFLIQGSNNQVYSDNVVLFNTNNVYVDSGLTNVFIIGATGGTITESNTTIINNVNITPKINWITDQSGYTLQLSDAFTTIVFNSDFESLYLLIPSGVTFINGTKIEFIQYGAGQIVFGNDPGVLLYSLNSYFATAGGAAQATLIKIDDGDNEWILYGDLAAL